MQTDAVIQLPNGHEVFIEVGGQAPDAYEIISAKYVDSEAEVSGEDLETLKELARSNDQEVVEAWVSKRLKHAH